MSILEIKSDEHFEIDRYDADDFRNQSMKSTVITFMFVLHGSVDIDINLEHFQLTKEMSCMFFPGEVVEFKRVSDDFEARLLKLDNVMISSAIVRMELRVLEALHSHRVSNLRGSQVVNTMQLRYITNIVDNLDIIYRNASGVYRNEQALCQVRCLLCFVADMIDRYGDESANSKYNRLQDHFRSFMNLISKHYKESREVSYYAEMMSLTPKYLNYICNTVAKCTCKSFIDKYIIVQLKNELLKTSKTIQEIAHEYNFANQSFLGCYFKKYTGMSPRKFRNEGTL